MDADFGVFDIEALNWNQFRVGCFMDSAGNAQLYDSPEALSARIETFKGRVFAHYGGRYDFFFLRQPRAITMSGSGILRAQLGTASLYDSWYLFQMSLAKLGKSVGELKLEGKSDRIHELTDAEVREHVTQDCNVLRVALLKHRLWCAERPHDEKRWPATAGGTAVYCLEAYEREGVAHLRAEKVDLAAWFDQYGAVTGGRVELWQVGKVKGPIHSYDIRSSYPTSWLDGPLPLGPWVRVNEEKRDKAGVYLCSVRQSRSTFPVVAPEHQWRYDGDAWLTHEEIAEVRLHGGRVKVERGWVSATDPVWFGNDFARAMYVAKQAGDPWAKVSINSAHGKFGQGILQTAHVLREGKWEADYELGFPSWHQRPLVSAYVLSRARIRLHRMLHALKAQGHRVLYVDTDCVHTTCPPEAFPGEQGAELGQWAHEYTADRAVYVAPKVYWLDAEGQSPKYAAKGLPKSQVTYDVLAAAARGDTVRLSSDAGLLGFRRLGGQWSAQRSNSTRRLQPQTGGKTYGYSTQGRTGKLHYRDSDG